MHINLAALDITKLTAAGPLEALRILFPAEIRVDDTMTVFVVIGPEVTIMIRFCPACEGLAFEWLHNGDKFYLDANDMRPLDCS